AARIRPDDRLRDEAIACMTLTDVRRLRQHDAAAVTGEVTCDAALERYAYSDPRGTVHVHSLADNAELFSLPGPGGRPPHYVFLRFSPGGERLAAGYMPTGVCLVWDLRSRKTILRVPHDNIGAALAFSPDGRRLATTRPDRSL